MIVFYLAIVTTYYVTFTVGWHDSSCGHNIKIDHHGDDVDNDKHNNVDVDQGSQHLGSLVKMTMTTTIIMMMYK